MSLLWLSKVLRPLALLFLVGACAPPERPADEPVGQMPPDGPPPADAPPALWRADDQRVSLRIFGHNGGAFEWEASPQSLTPAQREALSGLRRIENKRSCIYDLKEYHLVFVGAEGTERLASSREYNADCEPRGAGDFIDIETLEPLLATLKCVGAGSSSSGLSRAMTIGTDDGCRHGLRADEVWLKVVPANPGRSHTFTLPLCYGTNSQLELFDESGTVLLARSPPGSSTSPCPTLSWRLDAGTVYALRVTFGNFFPSGHSLLTINSH